jgi:hypothetical protein
LVQQQHTGNGELALVGKHNELGCSAAGQLLHILGMSAYPIACHSSSRTAAEGQALLLVFDCSTTCVFLAAASSATHDVCVHIPFGQLHLWHWPNASLPHIAASLCTHSAPAPADDDDAAAAAAAAEDGDADEQQAAAKPSKKKDKKGKKDMSSLFAALGEDGEAPAAGAAQLNRQGH